MACPKIAIHTTKQLDQPVEGWHWFSRAVAAQNALDRARRAAERHANQWLNQKEAKYPCPSLECNKTRGYNVNGVKLIEPVKRRWRIIFFFFYFIPVFIIVYVLVAKATATWYAAYSCSALGEVPEDWEEEK